MTFRLELSDNNIIKNAFESIHKIVDEITMTADSEALRLNCLSRDHITFITMELQKTVFDEYECDKPEKIMIDSTEFIKILKKCKNTDILELSTDDSNLITVFKGDATRTFKLGLIDMEYDNPQPPLIQYPSEIRLSSTIIKDCLDDMAIFSDKIEFIVDEDYLIVRTDGQMGDAETKYIHGENIKEVSRSMFSIPRLTDIFRASKFSKECCICIGDDMPIKVTFTLPTNDGQLNYLLAPRLEEE